MQHDFGTVYGVLLNAQAEWDAYAPQMTQPPYKAAPQAPVLYIKTANTWNANGGTIALPAAQQQVEVGATLALVMGRAARHVAAKDALQHAAHYVLMNDLSLPHTSYFRPPVKYKNLDGFLGLGSTLVAVAQMPEPASLQLEVRINGELRQTVNLAQMRRSAAKLIADVSEFMTLHPGDVLLLGLGADRPLASVGDRIDITAPALPTLGTLSHSVVRELA